MVSFGYSPVAMCSILSCISKICCALLIEDQLAHHKKHSTSPSAGDRETSLVTYFVLYVALVTANFLTAFLFS